MSIDPEALLKQLHEDERVVQAGQVVQANAMAQDLVDSLVGKAALVTDPKERERLLREAYDREIAVNGNSKKARMLKSGAFQGAAGGAGIGAVTGLGLGTMVGTLTGALVGTVVSIPTTALGGLVGAGAGVIHGPWIKLGGGSKDEKKEGGGGAEEEKIIQVPQVAIDSGAVEVDEKTGQVIVKDPEALKDTAAAVAAAAAIKVSAEHKKATGEPSERRKPRKLEIRSNKQATTRTTEPPTVTNDAKPRRKPPKLEVRSKKA